MLSPVLPTVASEGEVKRGRDRGKEGQREGIKNAGKEGRREGKRNRGKERGSKVREKGRR